MSLFLRDLLNICRLDLEFIEKYYRLIKDKMSFAELEDTPLKQIDANAILYPIFWHINNDAFGLIKNRDEFPNAEKKQVINICNKRIDEFCPFLNCFDSLFNNEIDYIYIEGKKIEEIANEVYFLLLENI
jgi:hypothetical protein